MKKVLILGGTRFFGRQLVYQLQNRGYHITILTRGKQKDSFGDQVHRIFANRSNKRELATALEGLSFDLVYDQICYQPQQALDAIEIFQGKVKRYIFTSTQSVYGINPTIAVEKNYDPMQESIPSVLDEEYDYQRGKQLAEAIFFQKAPFPVIAVRLPIVMGEEDYTKRLLFHLERIQDRKPIGILNPNANICFISAEEAGEFLAWIGLQNFTGPINACSNGAIMVGKLMKLFGELLEKPVSITSELTEENRSPYSPDESFYMSNQQATNLSFSFTSLMDWLPELVRKYKK